MLMLCKRRKDLKSKQMDCFKQNSKCWNAVNFNEPGTIVICHREGGRSEEMVFYFKQIYSVI